MRLITLAIAAALIACPALAGPVTLRDQPVDSDGRVTLGDLFEDAGAAAGVVVAARSGPTAVLEAGAVQAQAARAGLTWSNPQGLRRVIVREGAGAGAGVIPTSAPATGSAQTAVAARPGATVEVLTYARSLAAGDVVQPEDVVWAQVQAHQAPAGAPRDADDVIGLTARRALRAGAPVAARDLAAPQVIARGDVVTVAFVADGMMLTVTGRAQRAAAAGEPVQLVNLQSGRTIDAVAVAPGRAVTGPASSQARSDPRAYAALAF